ncbi:MAG: hypothetical protein CM15mP128_2770 [Methanobacteriota archaeon]|nr:MAG: hypothetical protein CM15mP128_2770 [Euryarchaeota archaeon]
MARAPRSPFPLGVRGLRVGQKKRNPVGGCPPRCPKSPRMGVNSRPSPSACFPNRLQPRTIEDPGNHGGTPFPGKKRQGPTRGCPRSWLHMERFTKRIRAWGSCPMGKGFLNVLGHQKHGHATRSHPAGLPHGVMRVSSPCKAWAWAPSWTGETNLCRRENPGFRPAAMNMEGGEFSHGASGRRRRPRRVRPRTGNFGPNLTEDTTLCSVPWGRLLQLACATCAGSRRGKSITVEWVKITDGRTACPRLGPPGIVTTVDNVSEVPSVRSRPPR